MLKYVEIFTDGACSGNPGPGGWGAILRYGKTEKSLSGGEQSTTNNKMELTAAIKALCALKEPCRVRLTTDSKYVCDGMNLGWAREWRKNGWKKADNKQVKNIELWEELLRLDDFHDIIYVWVRGHNGHPENERCDKLATDYCKKFKGVTENDD